MSESSVADTIYELMRSRRVCRLFTDAPVSEELLERTVAAARWASSAGNRHIHKFFITRDPEKIALVRSFAPGMITAPPAFIAILTDHDAARRERVQKGDEANQIDVGTAAQNMMNMAHALGLGTCPVTSFSKSGVAAVLDLPASLTPELILIVGHPMPVDRSLRSTAPTPVRARDLMYWETVARRE
ncbi:MAG: nitroreductase family protein [Thermomicrobiales bacterium]